MVNEQVSSRAVVTPRIHGLRHDVTCPLQPIANVSPELHLAGKLLTTDDKIQDNYHNAVDAVRCIDIGDFGSQPEQRNLVI